METNRLYELAAAIRMTCSGRALIDRRTSGLVSVVFDDSPEALEFSRGRSCLDELARTLELGVLLDFSETVDAAEIVTSLLARLQSPGAMPRLVVIENQGIFGIGYDKHDADRALACLLNKEKYRESEEPQRRAGRLEHCVAAVTGSAQGFGKGIAEELAREGAHIVVADLNDPVGQAFCAELNQEHGAGAATYCHSDVANLASMTALVEHTVRTFGGLDMFVANAGVLKAGSLDEMDEKAFDLVTNVNYKAFFLGTKAASAVMKLQHRFGPAHFMDIVQINSKSGLTGSNKNFAYAGSKFGGIGLTQSFALELVEYRIRVNSICPGNFYEGPLWSDPSNGLFVQYLNTGKVPGAKTIEDVKQSYMSKVPMKRGCSPLDVARAIFYVHEQEYETGQAIPVTGGQVMLN